MLRNSVLTLNRPRHLCSSSGLISVLHSYSTSPVVTWSSKHVYMDPYLLTHVQRSFLVPYFGLKSIINPERGDYVAGFGDAVVSERHLRALHKRMLSNESGRFIMKTKPVINEETLNLQALRDLPTDTLGHEYMSFMDEHGFSPDERSKVRFMKDSELAYVMARYRQAHDFWHVLSGLPISILGEVSLKWFEFSALSLPSCALSGLLGPLRMNTHERRLLRKEYIPWAMRAGGNCGDLLGYDYVNNMHKSTDEVRQELNFEKFRTSN